MVTISENGRKLTWGWTELEPTRQQVGRLRVSFYPGWRRVAVNGKEEEFSLCKDDLLVYPRGPKAVSWTMAPVRRLADLLELQLVWADGMLVLSDEAGRYFACRKGSRIAAANGQRVPLVKSPYIASFFATRKMYAPLRPICEAFSVQVSMDVEQHLIVLGQGSQLPGKAE